MPYIPEDVRRAIDKLVSLHTGDAGIVEVIAHGTEAIPALRHILMSPDPSGIYEPRRRAAQALATLGAYEVLMEFFFTDREIADPVGRMGEDAVVNAVAMILAKLRSEAVFQRVLELAELRPRTGLIAALSMYRRPDAIAILVDALAEDDCRPLAEAALKQYGGAAHEELLKAAHSFSPSPLDESETSRRKRRSALALLANMKVDGTPASASITAEPRKH